MIDAGIITATLEKGYVMDRPIKIFFYEDDMTIAQEIKKFIQRPPGLWNGPDPRVTHHYYAKHALQAIDQLPDVDDSDRPPMDIALLDVEELGGDVHAGLKLCKRVKKRWPSVPVVFLTSHETIEQHILGIEAGADDYLTKSGLSDPDYPQYIWTVILAQLKRAGIMGNGEEGVSRVYTNGSLRVNLDVYQIYWRGEQVNLVPSNIDIVDKLANNEDKGGCRPYRVLAAAGRIYNEENNEEKKINTLKKRIQVIRNAFTKVDQDFKEACTKQPYRYGIVPEPKEGYRWLADTLDNDHKTPVSGAVQ